MLFNQITNNFSWVDTLYRASFLHECKIYFSDEKWLIETKKKRKNLSPTHSSMNKAKQQNYNNTHISKIKMEGELSSCHERMKERLTCSKTYKHVSDHIPFNLLSYLLWLHFVSINVPEVTLDSQQMYHTRFPIKFNCI